jgi:hypothetical protein
LIARNRSAISRGLRSTDRIAWRKAAQELTRDVEDIVDLDARHTVVALEVDTHEIESIARRAGPPRVDYPVPRWIAVGAQTDRVSRPKEMHRGSTECNCEVEWPTVRSYDELATREYRGQLANRCHAREPKRPIPDFADDRRYRFALALTADDDQRRTESVAQTTPHRSQTVQRPELHRGASSGLDPDEAALVGYRSQKLICSPLIRLAESELEATGFTGSRDCLDQTKVLQRGV